jgi:hypothetical protein
MAKLTAPIALASVLALGLPGGKVAAQGQPTGQMCGPISELSTLHGVGPRVEEPGGAASAACGVGRSVRGEFSIPLGGVSNG